MEECKKRHSGTKVSKIANIFQGMPSREEEEMRGADVTVVRTESHLARFNNARALFEKLGEENRGFRIEKSPSAAASFAGTRGPAPVAPARSRSSSAGSVSPPRRIVTPTPLPPPAALNGDRLANGAAQPPTKPVKPSVLPKPEKPDRRFNKELIEKQRNWTAHFKSRAARNETETRGDSNRYPSAYQDRKSPEVPERYMVPSRVYSPPLSPCAGDSQVERPNTLPTSLINRGITGAKSPSPSPIKSISSVTSRPNSAVSPVTKSEHFTSPTARKEPTTTVQTKTSVQYNNQQPDTDERLYYKSRSSVSPVDEREFFDDELDNARSLSTERLQSPNLIVKTSERTSPVPQSPTVTPAILEPVTTPRSQKSPSPSARLPKSPIIPSSTEENKSPPHERESSVSPLPEDSLPEASLPTDNEPEDLPDNVDSLVSKSLQPSPKKEEAEKESTERNIRTEQELVVQKSVQPVQHYENVPSEPKSMPEDPSADDDVYEPVHYGDEWDDKVKRRSSTPESPASAAQVQEQSRSPLASPAASPVQRNVSSPPPSVHASPSPGNSHTFPTSLSLSLTHFT